MLYEIAQTKYNNFVQYVRPYPYEVSFSLFLFRSFTLFTVNRFSFHFRLHFYLFVAKWLENGYVRLLLGENPTYL